MSIEWLFPVKVNGLRIQMVMLCRRKRSVRECVRFLFYDITDQLCGKYYSYSNLRNWRDNFYNIYV